MDYKVITIAQQKGGVGKTTIAAHLAVAFAKKGLHVTIIDIDPQESLTNWFASRQQILGVNQSNIALITVSGWRLHSEIDRVKGSTDVIIIDSPPHTQTETKTAIRAADLVLIPVQPSPTDLWATNNTIDIVSKERIPHRLIINRYIQNSKSHKLIVDKYSRQLENKLVNRVIFSSSMADGLTAVEVSPLSNAAKEVLELMNEVSDLLFPEESAKQYHFVAT